MLTCLMVGLGGFLGAILRMLSFEFIHKILPPSYFFLATLFVNVLGSFLMGILFFYAQNKGISALVKNFIGIGFLGAQLFQLFLMRIYSFCKIILIFI